jgi:small subunit ribosomal protein S17e
MGRIKTALTKRMTHSLVKLHRPEFKTDFTENKVLVRKYADIPSKKMRNIVAGYVTRIMKRNQEIRDI